MEKSPFWMEISPFKCFSEAFRTFFEKQTPQLIFSIQNGEISILNGDFSIHFFQTCFELFFWKKNSTESFLRSEWRNLHSEWRFLHSHVSQKCSVFFKNISTEIFLHSSVFFERWFEHFFKNISTYNCLHPEWRFGDFSIHFFSEAFFVEKQTPQITFSIQNGEISILNGDFSIQILFRSVLIFF